MKDEFEEWDRVEELKKCQRCGGKADKAFIKSSDGSSPTPENFELMAAMCDSCEKLLEDEFRALASLIYGGECGCENCKKLGGTIH